MHTGSHLEKFMGFRERCSRAGSKGFTLIEILAALGIFGMLLMLMSRGFGVQLATNRDNEIRSGAVEAAEIFLDELRSRRGVQGMIPNSGTEGPLSAAIDGREYQVFLDYCAGTGGQYCLDRTRHITARVFFNGQLWYSASTIFTDFAVGPIPTPPPRRTQAPTPSPTPRPTSTPRPPATNSPTPPTATNTPRPTRTPTPPGPTPTPTRTPTPRPTPTPFPRT